jgi:ClpP class serine protease
MRVRPDVRPAAAAVPRGLAHAARVDLSTLFWILFIAQFFIPLLQKRLLGLQRQTAIRAIERSRHSRLITMIHRQETMSFLGFPVARYIDIEDSEDVLRAIRFTPPDMPIDLLLHTPGGLVLASEQIAFALKRHQGKVTVFVPHYAMSGGTLIALAGDEIVMDPNAVLGPVDPQLGTAQSSFAAASVMKALSQPNPNREDTTLILGDLAEKALRQVHATVRKLLAEHHSEADAERIASALADGQWTHDYPLDVEKLKELGITVGTELPRLVYDLMDLYPQTTQRRPGVEFIPIPYPQRTTEPPRKAER